MHTSETATFLCMYTSQKIFLPVQELACSTNKMLNTLTDKGSTDDFIFLVSYIKCLLDDVIRPSSKSGCVVVTFTAIAWEISTNTTGYLNNEFSLIKPCSGITLKDHYSLDSLRKRVYLHFLYPWERKSPKHLMIHELV